MPNQEDIQSEFELLTAYRQTLAIYLKQVAQLGSAYSPPGTIHGIREAREGIRRIKQVLQEWNTPYEEHPDDEDPPTFVVPQTNAASLNTPTSGTQEKASPPDHSADSAEIDETYSLYSERYHEMRAQQDAFDLLLRRSMPGASQYVQVKDKSAINRVMLGLSDYCKNHELWWFQGYANLPIPSVTRLPGDIWLIGYLECAILDMWIYRHDIRERQYVLLHLASMSPFGVYEESGSDRKAEEAGYYQGRYMTRGEYDDGFAIIDGQVVEVAGAELRRRNLIDDFLFIAPNLSVFNNMDTNYNDAVLHEVYEELRAIKIITPEILEPLRTLKRAFWMSYWD